MKMDSVQIADVDERSFGACNEIIELENRMNQEIMLKSGINSSCNMGNLILSFAWEGRQDRPSLILCEPNLDLRDFVQLMKNGRPGPTHFFDGTMYGDDSGRLSRDLFFFRNGVYMALLDEMKSGVICIEWINALNIDEQNYVVSLIDQVEREGRNIKIIATATPDFTEQFNAGKIEPRLYWRLLNPALTIPPLRNRRRDMKMHIERYRTLVQAETGVTREFPERTVFEMSNFEWPLNFKSLELTVRALIMQGPANTEVEREELYIDSVCKEAWLGERMELLGDDYRPPQRRPFRSR